MPGLLAALGRVEAPVLVVGGERDAATGVGACTASPACFPTAGTAVLPRAGHFPWVDEPEAFRSAVAAFLGTLPRDAGEPRCLRGRDGASS